MGFSLQSFYPSRGSKNPFGSFFPLLRFLSKPFGFEPALQRLAPLKKAVFLASQRINLGRRLCSLGPFGLSGILSDEPRRNSSPFSSVPLLLILFSPYEPKSDWSSGCFLSPAWRFPQEAPTCVTFLPTAFPPFSGPDESRVIFSPSSSNCLTTT
jgi:hypothetical protein